MAITINGNAVAKPVTVDSDSISTAAINVAYGGLKSYYHNRSENVNQVIHVITIVWDGINGTELGTIRTNWQAAADAYVEIVFDDVELPSEFVTTDTFNAIVYPGTALDVQWSQGWDSAGTGPITYQASAIFLSEPMSLVPL